MKRLATAVDESRDRQFQLAEEDVLLGDGERVRFHQCIGEAGDVLILYAASVNGIESDPCTGFLFPVAHRSTKVIRVLFQGCDQFPGGAVIGSLAGNELAVRILPHIIGDIGDTFVRVEEKLKISDQVLNRIPGLLGKAGKAVLAVIFDGVVPAHAAVFSEESPAALLCHLNDGSCLDGLAVPMKASPFLFTFPGVIPGVVS